MHTQKHAGTHSFPHRFGLAGPLPGTPQYTEGTGDPPPPNHRTPETKQRLFLFGEPASGPQRRSNGCVLIGIFPAFPPTHSLYNTSSPRSTGMKRPFQNIPHIHQQPHRPFHRAKWLLKHRQQALTPLSRIRSTFVKKHKNK